MGGCLRKSFTVNRRREAKLRCVQPFIFSISDAENVLFESDLGDYLLYRDYTTDRILLSVRYNSHIRHHRISEDNDLYYLNGQPYPYLDSIVLYHRRHKLDSLKLMKQAQLSARVVRLFSHKITSTNGNNSYTLNNENTRRQQMRAAVDINTTTAYHNHLANGISNPAFDAEPVILSVIPTHENSTNAQQTESLQSTMIKSDGNSIILSHSNNNNNDNNTPAVTETILNANLLMSNAHADGIANDVTDLQNNSSVSSWQQHLEPNGNLSDFNYSTMSSQASLLSRSSSDPNIQIERL